MRKLCLLVLASSLLRRRAGGGGSSGPPPETDDDFPLPLAAGMAPTPPMGWNSWNKFACNINEDFVKRIADAMVSTAA